MTKRLNVLLFCLAVALLGLWARLPVLFPGFILQRNINILEPGTPNTSIWLGAEYYNIAESLYYKGQYSDPFKAPTGPTAWMPPLYTFLLAGLLSVAENPQRLEVIVVVINLCVLVVIALVISTLNERQFGPRWFGISLGLFLAFYFYFFFWFFLSIHDHFLIAALVALMALELHRKSTETTVRGGLRWGILGGLASLSSPCLLFAWMVVTLFLGIQRRQVRWVIQAVLITVLFAMPWGIRNAITFGKFIPVKSNLMFDLAFANVQDVDGVYQARDFNRHPFVVGFLLPEFFEQRVGRDEESIIKDASVAFRALIANDPMSYIRKTANRLICATVYFEPHYADSGQRLLLLRRLLYPLPFIAILFILLSWRRTSDFHKVASILYLAYLTPFVLVAFYHRYYVPLVPLFVATIPVLIQASNRAIIAASRRLSRDDPQAKLR